MPIGAFRFDLKAGSVTEEKNGKKHWACQINNEQKFKS